MDRLKDKITIVTGCTSGIGKGIATRFVEEGATVIGVGRRAERLSEMEQAFADQPGQFDGFPADLTVKDNCYAVVEYAVEKYGRIDVLVNNAGDTDYDVRVGELSEEEWENIWNRLIKLNLEATMWASRRAIQFMKEQGGGNIINVASICGLLGAAGGAAYTATKHAVVGLTKNTGFLYAQDSIRCNAICPGGVVTEITDRYFSNMEKGFPDPEGHERMEFSGMRATGMAFPENLGDAAVFLASDESEMITGAAIPVDNGMTAF